MHDTDGLKKYPSINVAKFSARLREACRDRNVSARELKDYLHLASVQAVYLWLSGKRLPSLDNLYAISSYLEVSIDVLLGSENADRMSEILLNDHLPMHGKRVLVYWKQLQREENSRDTKETQ